MDQPISNYFQPPPMAPETPLTATLEAREWNLVQAALHELPMKLVRALSEKIAQQLFMQAHEIQRPRAPMPATPPEDYGPIEEQLP